MKKSEKKQKSSFARIIQSPKTTIGIFVLAAVLLGYGGMGAAQAIPTVRSTMYGAEMSMSHIGVTLVENCNDKGEKDVANRDYTSGTSGPQGTVQGTLLSGLGGKLTPGEKYNEVLRVRNSGSIPEFVRVTIRKYWMDASGKEIHSAVVSPDKIDLNLLEGEWVIDASATTTERTVLYRLDALAPGDSSGPLTDYLKIDKSLAEVVQSGDTTIVTEYKYNGYSFVIEATVDAVQTHNAAAAIKSAWGRTVTVNGDNTRITLG